MPISPTTLPGTLIEHTQWGLGKVMEVRPPYVVVHFAGLEESPRRKLQLSAAQLSVAPVQSHPVLDEVVIRADAPRPAPASTRAEPRRTRVADRSRARGIEVWWLALDLDRTSFDEVAERQVIAQGFPKLGDVSDLIALAGVERHREAFEHAIHTRFDAGYGDGRDIPAVRAAADPAAELARQRNRAFHGDEYKSRNPRSVSK